MAIAKYNPNTFFEAIFNDPFFSDSFGTSLLDRGLNRRNLIPATNIARNDNELTFEMSVPGVSRGDLNITTEGNTLTISGETNNIDREFVRQEFTAASFKRSFDLPSGADTENVAARYDNGILTVAVNLEHTPRSRKIDIQ